MATERQIAANRTNAQKSTGPQSAEGKATSARNHLSNGFSSNAILIPGENPEEFRASMVALAQEHQPVTETEQILLERMAFNQWLSLRASRLHSQAFVAQMLGTDKFALPKDLPLLIRYKTAADNGFDKARNELVKAKKQRLNQEIGFEPQTAAEAPAEPVHPTPEAPSQQPEPAQATPQSPIFPAAKPDFNFTPEELSFELCPEAHEFIKNAA